MVSNGIIYIFNYSSFKAQVVTASAAETDSLSYLKIEENKVLNDSRENSGLI